MYLLPVLSLEAYADDDLGTGAPYRDLAGKTNGNPA